MDGAPLRVGHAPSSAYFFSNVFDAINTAEFFPDIIINQEVLQAGTSMMENYQMSGNCLPNYPYHLASSFLYPPIIFYDPSLTFIPQNFTPFHLNFTPNSSANPPAGTVPHPAGLPCDISQERLETNDQWKAHSQNIPHSRPQEEHIQPIRITNRNVLPNNLNLLLSYIRRVNKSGRMVQKIINRLGEAKIHTAKKFYSYQAYLKEQVPFHKTKHTLREITEYQDSNYRIFTAEEQRFYNKVCRILIAAFLKDAYLPTLLTSSKIHRTSKTEHLKIRKLLLLKLRAAPQEEMEPYRLIEN